MFYNCNHLFYDIYLQDFIKKQATDITEFDEALVSRHIALNFLSFSD